MAHTLIDAKGGGEGGFDPEGFIGPVADDFEDGAQTFNDACKHGANLPGKILFFKLDILMFSHYLCPPKTYQGGIIIMLIIDSKDCENIDKALKKYKKKFEKSKVLLQLRERQAFIKPSVRRRGEVLKAVYKQNIFIGKIEK